jgi:hypothetical protein
MIFQTIQQMKKNNHTVQNKYAFERRLFKVLVTLCILAVCLYIYSLSSVIYGVVARRTLERELVQLHSDIGEMEAKYLINSNQLTYESARELGFIKPTSIIYESQERFAFNTAK